MPALANIAEPFRTELLNMMLNGEVTPESHPELFKGSDDTGVEVVAKKARAKGGNSRKASAPKKSSARRPRKASKASADAITSGEAWEILGGDENYVPQNPERPATGRQLWAMNAKGLLNLS